MKPSKIFISYSHADEWLKDELISHFAALKRNGLVDVWHDRRIPPGGLLDDEIDTNLRDSDLCLLLISADFIGSDYCFKREYEEAVRLRAAGEMQIIPIILRPCDWDVGNLKQLKALPKDATPVTKGADSKRDKHMRDPAWVDVINGIKFHLEEAKKKATPPDVRKEYYDNLFLVDFIRHPSLAQFDERLILVDPDVYCETEKEQVTSFERLAEMCGSERAVLISGSDRSGKSVIAKKLHYFFSHSPTPAILISGKQIRNRDIDRLIRGARDEQFQTSDFPLTKFRVIIDDFDECSLPDVVKEKIIETLCEKYRGCVLFSFSNAPSVLFAANGLPSPRVFLINPVTDAKLYTLVQKWVTIGLPFGEIATEGKALPVFEKVLLVFEQTGLEKAPHTAATFLQFIDAVTGSDISFSSFAACYEMLIAQRLAQAGVPAQSIDEARNFLSLVAYKAYAETSTACLSKTAFDECVIHFEEQFLSSGEALRKLSTGHFIVEEEGHYRFHEEYIWYFLSARYAVKSLQLHDRTKYEAFVRDCTANIFQRKFANIVIFIAYFSDDKLVLESLLKTLDGLFSKATDWLISDDTRELMVGLINRDPLEIESGADISVNRLTLLQEKIADIIEDAERAVARYTLPFINAKIGDAENVEDLDVAIDHDSYIRSVNALLRTHSVIGQILSGRSGTFSATLVLDCITRMVKASGRYVSLNHAIAAVLIYDKDESIKEVGRALRGDHLTPEEKYQKVTRIFAFWSVYLAHAGLARYLNQEHSIRALELLSKELEGDSAKTDRGNLPFNFSLVKTVAKLYNTGRIDRQEIDDLLKKYGENSSIFALLRVVIHMYAYYMPLSIEDKQWVSHALRMPLRRIEMQRLKAITSASQNPASVRAPINEAS